MTTVGMFIENSVQLEDERLHRRAREEELETLRATVTAIETENAQLKCRLAKRVCSPLVWDLQLG